MHSLEGYSTPVMSCGDAAPGAAVALSQNGPTYVAGKDQAEESTAVVIMCARPDGGSHTPMLTPQRVVSVTDYCSDARSDSPRTLKRGRSEETRGDDGGEDAELTAPQTRAVDLVKDARDADTTRAHSVTPIFASHKKEKAHFTLPHMHDTKWGAAAHGSATGLQSASEATGGEEREVIAAFASHDEDAVSRDMWNAQATAVQETIPLRADGGVDAHFAPPCDAAITDDCLSKSIPAATITAATLSDEQDKGCALDSKFVKDRTCQNDTDACLCQDAAQPTSPTREGY